MSGTRKLEKFELDESASAASEMRTRKIEKFDLALAESGKRAAPLTIPTPIAEVPLATLSQAMPSIVPPEPSEQIAAEPGEASPSSSRISQAPRAIDREPDVEKLRTRLARKFTTLADEVTGAFEDFRIGAGVWGAELTAPEGMSTSGGKHALQHLRLRPRRSGHPVLIGGVVDVIEKTAELRDHEHVSMLHRARFGQALEITYDEWEQFLRKAEVVLAAVQIRATRVAAPRELRMRARGSTHLPASARTRRAAAFVALGIVAPLALYVLVRVIMVLLH